MNAPPLLIRNQGTTGGRSMHRVPSLGPLMALTGWLDTPPGPMRRDMSGPVELQDKSDITSLGASRAKRDTETHKIGPNRKERRDAKQAVTCAGCEYADNYCHNGEIAWKVHSLSYRCAVRTFRAPEALSGKDNFYPLR